MKRLRQTYRLSAAIVSGMKIALVSCILTAVLVLILAFTMKWEWIGMDSVDAVNTCIKAVSACVAGFLSSKLKIHRRWLAAGLIGMGYMMLSFAVFAILNGGFQLSAGNLSDILMAFACASCTCIAAGIVAEQLGAKQSSER